MENKPLKSLVLPNSRGENVNYILCPDWENVENKPTEFPISWTLVNGRPNIMPGENDGIENDISTSSGAYSVALGASVAQGDYSFAMGEQAIAYGNGASALGHMTIAQGNNSHVQGRYNLKDDNNKYAHIVGNGTAENARSNAHTLDWDGNAWYAGSLSATKLILTPESYGTSLPETGVEGQIFFLIGGNNATEQDGIVTMDY